MHAKLKQAIAATRTGAKKEAQVLLTQVLRDDPEEVQAWYLLSLLIDDREKQIAYLKKAIALDPGHEKAQARLAQLQPGLPPAEEPEVAQPPVPTTEERPLPAESPPTELQAEDAMPDWLNDELAAAATPASEAEESLETADLPDWLDEMAPDAAAGEEVPPPVAAPADQPTLVSPTPPEPVVESDMQPTEDTEIAEESVEEERPSGEDIPIKFPTTDDPDDKQQQIERLNRVLTVLTIGAVLFFIMLIYLLFTNFLG